MSADRGDVEENFLGRWSRMKTQAREAPAAVPEPTPQAPEGEAPPELPPIEELTFESDFKGFFHPKVGEETRRAALRKLFSEPHFNVMDGLDVYIDDYSKSEPIPAAMLASLRQAQRILDWASGKDDAEAEAADPRPQETLDPHAAAPAIEHESPPPAAAELPPKSVPVKREEPGTT